MKPKTQYMVIDRQGHLYAASNAHTQEDAKERHYADIGKSWPQAHKDGDRLVRVSISVIKTVP
jgi:hypothetical protein